MAELVSFSSQWRKCSEIVPKLNATYMVYLSTPKYSVTTRAKWLGNGWIFLYSVLEMLQRYGVQSVQWTQVAWLDPQMSINLSEVGTYDDPL